ncbi:MAG: DMT family protein [Verrucomicrobiota bacterium]
METFVKLRWTPVVLLLASNVFMTFAWYGHLKYKSSPLWIAIIVSWGIAFFEYCLMVPANRFGNSNFSATELKIMQEVITLCVFCGFAILYLGERIRWNHLLAFCCILGAVAFTFIPDAPKQVAGPPASLKHEDGKGPRK